MKFFFTTFLFALLLGANCFSQHASPTDFYLSKLSAGGVLLDSGWKFQLGDDVAYAQQDYDDRKWKSINPALDVAELPQIKKGVVWFRLHLFLDSNFSSEQLALTVEQSGASEIYLNGNLIHRFGVFNTDVSKVRAYDPMGLPIAFPVKPNGPQILAIRYALQPGVRYTTIFASHNYAVRASVNIVEGAASKYKRSGRLDMQGVFILAVFLMLAVLHSSFYLLYRSQRANLYFSLFAVVFIAASCINFNSVSGGHWVEPEYYLFNLAVDLIFVSWMFMVTALYYLLDQKRDWWYAALWIIVCLFMVAWALPGYWGWEIGNRVASILINLEVARISFKAILRKKKGAWIIACGSLCYLLSWTGGFMIAGRPGDYEDMFTIIVFTVSWLSIPVSASVYLGVDFALTNRLLQQKLFEIEGLSQKTIMQEKEKQQILSSQKETLEQQVSERTAELKRSLEHLRSTQQQLIQSEKMASLGELTAGIAHEIQNPLNFVNNFSDVNKELVDELKSELAVGNLQSVNEIADTLKENEEKINHHGKRADSIVKGMLQHSRTSSGQKELTDVNTLCDEYLRLAYHGLRAKDKSFNAKIETDFDPAVGKINIVPHEIGRVLLNLINNAFYAVNERGKRSSNGYEPTVAILTNSIQPPSGGRGVQIKIIDNGGGIPPNIVDKIFQPFFTTKPTGQGTGLGLSLAYDIVKAHGGEITVETKEGKGSEFVIRLNLKSIE